MDKIVCFGKNYQDHMQELGDKPVSAPVIFLKPSSILKQCKNWDETVNVVLTEKETHYECELVLRLKNGGYKMTLDQANSAIDAYTVGLDMTLRLEQTKLKANGHPWTVAKVFPDSCIIGPWIETKDNKFMDDEFKFTLDQQLKQASLGQNMLFKPTDLIMYASSFFPLCAGDILFTGTPSGVGAVHDNSKGVLQIAKYQYTVAWKIMT